MNNTTVDDIMQEFENEATQLQIDVAKQTLDTLFQYSPHREASLGGQSQSEYDANHKVSINGVPESVHHAPTGSAKASRLFIQAEKNKTEKTKTGETISFFNTTGHDRDVEYGESWPVTEGYLTYTRTQQSIEARY